MRLGQVVLTRDVIAIQVPSGIEVTLPAQSSVCVTQQLGGTFTVQTDQGFLARIEGRDADALGMERAPTSSKQSSGRATKTDITEALRTCYDPEIPVNILELGLIYEHDIEEGDDGTRRAVVKMTLTAPGCGMGQVLYNDVEQKLRALPGIDDVAVELTFDPPWGPERMSEEARLQLGF